MQEDIKKSIGLKELENNAEEEHLKLVLEIEEKKFHHRIARRPVALYWVLLLTNLAIIILAISAYGIFGSGSFIAAWASFSIFIFGVSFIGLTIYFFLDYEPARTRHGFRAIHRIQELISLKEDIEEHQVQLRILDELITARRPHQEKYQEELSYTIKQYQGRANRNRNAYYFIQMIIIFCSLLVTGLTSGLTGLVAFLKIPLITPAFSFAVSFLTAMITLFRWRERGHNLQQTADAIEFEISCYKKGIFGYKNLSDEEAFTRFAEEVERLRNEQRKRQQQLEQSSETKHTTG